jgi:hypothetical protein
MPQVISAVPEVTIGLDLGDKFSQVFVLNREGEVLEEGRVQTTPIALEKKFASYQGARVVIEASVHSP